MADGWKVDCFAIEEGAWQPRPANICVIRASSKRAYRERGDLYLVIQPAPNSVLSQMAIDALRESAARAYHGSAGSVTRGLRAALVAGNTWLFEQNMRVDPDHRIVLGLHYAVLREREIYLAQIGPALAIWLHGGAVDQYPPDSVWLRSETPTLYELDREPPAGWRRDVEPDLFHITLSPGDTLILASPRLHHLVPIQALQEALEQRSADSGAQTIERMTQGRDLSVMVVEWATEGVSDEGRSERRQAVPKAPKPLITTMPVTPEETLHAGPEEPTAAGQKSVAPITPPETLAAGRQALEPPPTGDTQRTAAQSQAPRRWSREARRSAPSDEQALPETETRPSQAAPSETTEDSATQDSAARSEASAMPWGDLRGNLSQGVERARQGTEELLTRVLPETSSEPGAEVDTARRPLSLAGRALLGVALVIPLVMALIVIMTRVQYERAQRRVFAQIQELAQARYDAASTMANTTYRRDAMHEALATAQEGLAIEPQDELLTSLVRQIEHNLDEIDGVERLSRFTQLALLDSDVAPEANSIPGVSAARIVVQDLDLFLLSRASDRVYRYLLNNAGDALQPAGGNAVMLQKGAIQEGVRMGEIIDITWMEAEGQRTRDGFAALDRSGSLIAYDLERGMDVMPMADSDTWIKPIALGCFSGNAYVLDPILGTILKYIPTDNAYVNPPSNFINPTVHVDLTGAVDMAVDGSIYVLFADGKIMKFFKGDPQPFEMRGLPGSMRSPTTLFVSGEKRPEADGYVYVVDSGNERILEFDKAGNYLRQFQAKAGYTQFKGIQGIYVDGQRGRLFILSGGKLWFTNLPSRKVG